MKIHIISTINGLQNEGMRNIATHMGRCFEAENTVVYSALRDIYKIPFRCMKADVTIIFARCTAKVYSIAKIAEKFSKKLWIVVVQKPKEDYVEKNNKKPIDCNYLALSDKDTDDICLAAGKKVFYFKVGIDANKFHPVSAQDAMRLKAKYGFGDKPLVVHVGHCSEGRGLEDFAHIDSDRYDRLVVTSGMFTNEKTESFLNENGIKIISGYIENVNEIYQMADAYLFPTKSEEHVISIPLSVMEALACGTPVIGYKEFGPFASIESLCEKNAMFLINDSNSISEALECAIDNKTDRCLLTDVNSWKEVSDKVLKMFI